MKQHVILVDADSGRAEFIGKRLSALGCSIKRIDRPASLQRELTAATILLVADDAPDSVRLIVARMIELKVSLTVIAFGSRATAHRVCQAMDAGAADYLEWPCDPAMILAAMAAARGAKERVVRL